MNSNTLCLKLLRNGRRSAIIPGYIVALMSKVPRQRTHTDASDTQHVDVVIGAQRHGSGLSFGVDTTCKTLLIHGFGGILPE